MSQRLIFPFTSGMIMCGYKTQQYKSYWGYPHYGIDITSIQGGQTGTDHMIRASGDGVVVWCTYDTPSSSANSLGYAVAIQYNNCVSRDGSVMSFVARYMHSPKVYVKKGQTVKAGDPIAEEGKVGTNDYHVHMELDVDTAYPQYSPQVSAGHGGWKKGTDSTVNPSIWLWQDKWHKTVPYNFSNKSWITLGIDDNIPVVPTVTPIDTSAEQLAELKAQYEAQISALKAINEALTKENATLTSKIEKFRSLAKEAASL